MPYEYPPHEVHKGVAWAGINQNAQHLIVSFFSLPGESLVDTRLLTLLPFSLPPFPTAPGVWFRCSPISREAQILSAEATTPPAQILHISPPTHHMVMGCVVT